MAVGAVPGGDAGGAGRQRTALGPRPRPGVGCVCWCRRRAPVSPDEDGFATGNADLLFRIRAQVARSTPRPPGDERRPRLPLRLQRADRRTSRLRRECTVVTTEVESRMRPTTPSWSPTRTGRSRRSPTSRTIRRPPPSQPRSSPTTLRPASRRSKSCTGSWRQRRRRVRQQRTRRLRRAPAAAVGRARTGPRTPLPGYWRDLGMPHKYLRAHQDVLTDDLGVFAEPRLADPDPTPATSPGAYGRRGRGRRLPDQPGLAGRGPGRAQRARTWGGRGEGRRRCATACCTPTSWSRPARPSTGPWWTATAGSGEAVVGAPVGCGARRLRRGHPRRPRLHRGRRRRSPTGCPPRARQHGLAAEPGQVLAASRLDHGRARPGSRRCRGASGPARRGVPRSGRGGSCSWPASPGCSSYMFTIVAISGSEKPSRLPRRISCEPDPVALVEDPRGAAALGGEQPDVLVVPQRAQGDVVLLGELGDGPGLVGVVGHGLALPYGSDLPLLTLT